MRYQAALLASVLAATVASADDARLELVLVLDRDKPGDTFYAEAKRYYRMRDVALVEGLGSLSELRDAMAQAAERAGRPLGTVHVVVHGSEWTGLAVPVVAGGQPARPDVVADAVARPPFAPLPDAIAGSATTIELDSCGLGKRPKLLADLATLLGGDDAERPAVTGADAYVAFTAPQAGLGLRDLRRYRSVVLAGEWAGDRASLDAAFLRRFEGDPIVERDLARTPTSVLRRLPITFRVSIPDTEELARAGSPRAWALLQPALIARLASAGLSARQLEWDQEGGAIVGRGTLFTLIEAPAELVAMP